MVAYVSISQNSARSLLSLLRVCDTIYVSGYSLCAGGGGGGGAGYAEGAA